jgi:PAS domain S-box-containing protein
MSLIRFVKILRPHFAAAKYSVETGKISRLDAGSASRGSNGRPELAEMRTATTVQLQRTGRALCLSGAALGALGLGGWFFEADIVTTFIAGRPAMMPNTAVSLMMLGFAAAISPLPPRAGRLRAVMASALGLSVLGIAVATIAEYVAGWDLGIDQVLMSDAGAATYPGRPSPITAAALTLLATARLVTDRRGIVFAQLAEWLTLAAASLPFVSLVGHLFGAGQIYEMRTASAVGVALPTAIALLLIAVGMLLRHPSTGQMKVATSRGPGGILIRRLGIVAILGPPLLGVIVHRAIAMAGFVDLPLTLAALTVGGVPVALSVIFRTARRIDEVHNALEESRQQARALIEGSADGIFVADLEGRYTDVNSVGCQMLGRSREEIIGKTIVDLIPPDEVGRLADARSRLLEGATQTAEWHLRKKDGTFLPVEVSAKILPDGRWQGVARDITRRKAAEEAAHRSEARLEGIISIAADAIISIDEQQRIVMYNEGARRIFGWSRAEAIGKPLDILIPTRFADAHRGHIKGFEREPASARMMHGRPMVVGLRKNGEEFPAEAAISKIADDTQRLFNVFLRDVTATKHLEADLREAVKRFRFIAESGEILGSSLDIQKNVQSLAELAVRSLCDCCIITMPDEDGGLITTRVDAPDGLNPVKIRVERVAVDSNHPLESPATHGREPVLVADVNDEWLHSHVHDDSTLALVRGAGARSLMALPIVAGEQVTGTMLLLAAESGRRYRDADLQVAQDLARRTALAAENARLYRVAKAAIRARDEILSIVAHDLRSPLAAAQVGARLLAGQVPEDRREASRRTAEAIHRSIRLATRLVDDLLDVARIDAGKLGLDLREISPEVIVYNAVESYLPLATGASIRLEAEVAPGLPLVLADEERIQQVLGNLLNNAIKFTPRGGRVRIVAEQEGAEIRFSLIDTGTGISPDHLPRVFDRFWQSRTTDRRGAGLGLAIAKGIVEAHGGHIRAESVMGVGSTFSFTLRVFSPQADLRTHDRAATTSVSVAPGNSPH